jgi:hypothetical protein
MTVRFERLVAQDLNHGYGTVQVTMPTGGTAPGDKVGLHTWTGMLNVADFGAAGDGAADDTAAIQRAIDTAPSGGLVFFPTGRYKVTTLAVTKQLTLQGTGANSYNSDRYGSATWRASPPDAGSVIESPATTGSVIGFVVDYVCPLNLRDLCIKGLGDDTRTTVGVTLGAANKYTGRSVWSNVSFLNLHVGLTMVGAMDCVFTNLVVNGCDTGVSLGLNSNQNVFAQLNATNCNTGLRISGATKNYVVGGAMQACHEWAMDFHGEENDVAGVYFENVSAKGGAIICRGPTAGDANTFKQVHLGTPHDNVQFDSNGNLLEVSKYSPGRVTFSPGSHLNRLIGNHSGPFTDSGNGNWRVRYQPGAGQEYTFSPAAAGGMAFQGAPVLTHSLATAGGTHIALQARDDLAEGRIVDPTHNFSFLRFAPNEAGGRVGFYNVAPVERQILATGNGLTVDAVITALQKLGLVRQA